MLSCQCWTMDYMTLDGQRSSQTWARNMKQVFLLNQHHQIKMLPATYDQEGNVKSSWLTYRILWRKPSTKTGDVVQARSKQSDRWKTLRQGWTFMFILFKCLVLGLLQLKHGEAISKIQWHSHQWLCSSWLQSRVLHFLNQAFLCMVY